LDGLAPGSLVALAEDAPADVKSALRFGRAGMSLEVRRSEALLLKDLAFAGTEDCSKKPRDDVCMDGCKEESVVNGT